MDSMKSVLALCFAVALLLLCACGQTNPVQQKTEGAELQPSSGEQTTQTGQTEEALSTVSETTSPILEMPPLVSTEIPIDKPVVVELPEDAQPDKTMVFQERRGETAAVYQDVSEQKNVLAIPAAYGVIGETVTVTLGVYGQVELCAMDLRLTYDPAQLKFLGYEAEGDALILNGEERGVIYANYLLVENASEGFDLCTLSFQILTGETCDSVITPQIIEMVAMDGGDIVACDYSVVPGQIHLNAVGG